MSESIREYILFALAVLLLANLFFSITSSLMLSFMIIVAQFVCLHKKDLSLVFLLLGSIFGAFFAQKGVRFVGSFLTWGAALYLVKDLILDKRIKISCFSPLIFFILFVVFSIIVTDGGEYSQVKLALMLMNTVQFTIAFCHLILNKDNHSFIHLGLVFVLLNLFSIIFMNELMGTNVSWNQMVFSFAGFRNDINEYLRGDQDAFYVGYQSIGINSCIGLIFALFSTDNFRRPLKILTILLSAIVVWYSAARQALLLYFIIWLIYFILYKGLSIKNIFIISILFISCNFFLLNLDNDSVDFLMGSTEGMNSARELIIQSAMNQFNNNPIFGVGFGRFYTDGEYGINEHNLFVELLAELGITGFIVFIFLCINPIRKSYSFIKQNIQTYAPFCLILFSYFLRSMFSSDLRETIVILILVICIQMGCNNKISNI